MIQAYERQPGFAPALLAALLIALPPPLLLLLWAEANLSDALSIMTAVLFAAMLSGAIGGHVFWRLRIRAEQRWWRGERPW